MAPRRQLLRRSTAGSQQLSRSGDREFPFLRPHAFRGHPATPAGCVIQSLGNNGSHAEPQSRRETWRLFCNSAVLREASGGGKAPGEVAHRGAAVIPISSIDCAFLR